MNSGRFVLVALAAALVPPADATAATRSLGAPAARECPRPAVTDLGAPPGGTSDVAEMNDHGWLVGTMTSVEHGRRATIWRGGSSRLLEVPRADGEFSAAADVNNHGWVVGSSGTSGWPGDQRAWIWHGGAARLLPRLPGGGGTAARRISDTGVIVGTAMTADGHVHPVRWINGRIQDLGLPDGATDGFAFGVNAAGDVSGTVFFDGDLDRAFVWSAGAFKTYKYGQANVIDDAGRAGGRYDNIAIERSEAAWWAPDGTLHDLGIFADTGPESSGWVFATDGKGNWGGFSTTANETRAGFVSRSAGPLLALPALNGQYGADSAVLAMSRRGDAAGRSVTASGASHATLWRCAFAQARPLQQAAAVTAHTAASRETPSR